MATRSEPLPTLVVACALALGTAVSLGLARFSYAMFLPPMRADLGWSYLTAGAMNTANAAGYLAGALLAPAWMRAFGTRGAFLAGTAATAGFVAAHGLTLADPPLYLFRFLSGLVSAVAFVAGGLLAAQLVGAAPSPPGRTRPSAGLVLGIYYGGAGLGIVASAIGVPLLAARPEAHAWQGGWIALGVLGAIATAVIAAATRGPAFASLVGGGASTRLAGFAWRRFLPALFAYLMFGLGYIGYMTFIVTLLREQRVSDREVIAFYALLGAAVAVSPWLWARVLQRFRGGETLALMSALLVLATLLPVWRTDTAAVFASGILFGGVMLSLVASTTALVRHNLAAADWPAGITGFTIVFAAGQIIGPSGVGFIADRAGSLRAGLACSAALLALGALVAGRQKPLDR
ncbi:MAG: YbfB/YjiJ family MFS transporter [Caldimonas sp.]